MSAPTGIAALDHRMQEAVAGAADAAVDVMGAASAADAVTAVATTGSRRGLRRFTGAPAQPASERCSLCGTAVPEEHRHLVDPGERSLVCACTACAVLFDHASAGGGRFRSVPRRVLTERGHAVDAAAWDRLQIPVGVVFLFRDTALDRLVAFYPSPAGATQSELDPAELDGIGACTRLAALLEPDVEALLVRRAAGEYRCYLVPIDICYELVGRMRLHWHGFDGGAVARAELEAFFARVEDAAADIGAGAPAR